MKNIEEIIEQSLCELVKVANDEKMQKKNKLIFPKYSNGEIRISEQEAKLLFIEKVIKDYDGFYSVETPTGLKYRFSEGGKKLDIPLLDIGKSGNVDVCLYDNSKNLKHLVEFKAHISKQFDFNKDFLKLKHENNGTKLSNYFVQILKSYKSETIKGLKNRYEKVFESECDRNDIFVFVCMLKIPKKYNCKNVIFFNPKNYEKELNKYLNE